MYIYINSTFIQPWYFFCCFLVELGYLMAISFMYESWATNVYQISPKSG